MPPAGRVSGTVFTAVSRSGVSRLPRPITQPLPSLALNVHNSANQGRTSVTAKPTSGVIVSDRDN